MDDFITLSSASSTSTLLTNEEFPVDLTIQSIIIYYLYQKNH